MNIYNRTFEGAVTADAIAFISIMSLDLSAYSERKLIIEIKTDIYDPLGPTFGGYAYNMLSVYNSAGATVQTVVYGEDVRYKKSNTSNSGIETPTYTQATQILHQTISSNVSTSRDIRYKIYVKIIAF